MLVGQQYPALAGLATCLPEFDFETYSEAGFIWGEKPGYWKKAPKKPALDAVLSPDGVWRFVPPEPHLEKVAGSGNKSGLYVVGTYNYVQHPTFEILQLAYNLKDGYGVRIWRPGMPNPQPLFDWINSYYDRHMYDDVSGLLESWNNFFEFTVWNEYCVPLLGWPTLHLLQMRDAMAKAAMSGYPRALANTGEVLKLKYQKDPEGKALIDKLTMPRNPTKANPARRWTRETAAADFAKFDAYNVTDILSESEASMRIPDQSPRELEIWQADQRINHRGVYVDSISVDNCIALIEQAGLKYNGELQRITNGRVKTFNQVKETCAWIYETHGVLLDKLDQEVVEEELKKAHHPAVLRVLKIRATMSFGSVKKLYSIKNNTCRDGRLRDMFAYGANHTQHWAGVGPQLMNLYKSEKFNKPDQIEMALTILASRDLDYVERVFANGPPWDDKDNEPMEALDVIANCLRSMLMARPGTRLMIADYNAIQAVITAALAGEKWQLDVFHSGKQIYLETASQLTGKAVEFYEAYRLTEGKHHPDRQKMGKIPTLANGFGAWIGGWRRFDDKGVLGDDAEVKALILKMWAKNPMTKELWGGQTRNKFNKAPDGSYAPEYQQFFGLEGAAVQAVRNPGVCYPYRGVSYQMHGDALYCQVPGGGAPLIYHEPRLRPSTRDYASPWELRLTYMGWNSNQTKGQGGWIEMDLYGGVLTQNAVAKVHREFQADTLVALDKTGVYLPVHHAHDENMCEVEIGRGSVPEYLEIVNRGKPWAVDDWGRPWPIRAPSADEVQRYGKYE